MGTGVVYGRRGSRSPSPGSLVANVYSFLSESLPFSRHSLWSCSWTWNQKTPVRKERKTIHLTETTPSLLGDHIGGPGIGCFFGLSECPFVVNFKCLSNNPIGTGRSNVQTLRTLSFPSTLESYKSSFVTLRNRDGVLQWKCSTWRAVQS